jgi:hypothetical protein
VRLCQRVLTGQDDDELGFEGFYSHDTFIIAEVSMKQDC